MNQDEDGRRGYDGLPPDIPALQDLMAPPRLVVWRLVPRSDGKQPTKVPYMPGAGFKASISAPTHWFTFSVPWPVR